MFTHTENVRNPAMAGAADNYIMHWISGCFMMMMMMMMIIIIIIITITVSGFDLAWFSSLSSKRLCVFSLHGAIQILIFFAYILLFTF